MSKKILTPEEIKRKEEIAKRKEEREKIKSAREKVYNKDLVERFPFLLPKDWEGNLPDNYDYSYTLLDDMPEGWKNLFGTQLCEDIKELLVRANYLDKYELVQVKEKYGSLRWYDDGVPAEIYDELQEVLDHYEDISAESCVFCGAHTKYYTAGWVMPICLKCAKKLGHKVHEVNILT